MKKRRILACLALGLAATLSGCIVGVPINQFPAIRQGLRARIGQGEVCMQMNQAWYNGRQAWYICWDNNTLRRTEKDLFKWVTPYPEPKLNSALGTAAAPMYVVTNFNQLPVLSTVPGNDNYSGLWQVYNITWNKGVKPRFITNTNQLPGPEEAQIVATGIVQNCPVVATGPLNGCNWTPAPCGDYRIKQALAVDVKTKSIILPSWATFGQDAITKKIYQTEILITDTDDPQLAELLQCNLAPALANMPCSDTQKIWILDWTQQPYSPPGQLPIIENVLREGSNCLNTNYDYSPVMDLTLLARTTDAPNSVVNNPALVKHQIDDGFLRVVSEGQRLNVLLVNYWKWTNTWQSWR